MKKLLLPLSFATFLFSNVSMADYASHSFVDINVGQTECLRVAAQAARAIGITETKIAEEIVVYGMNANGYSLQFTCNAKIGVGYYILNGSSSEKRGELARKFFSEIMRLMNK